MGYMGDSPKLGGTISGVPILKMIIFWGDLHCGPSVLGNNPVGV